MNLTFKKKFFLFKLSKKVDNSNSSIEYKSGWIIKLINTNNEIGFGEISPLQINDLGKCLKQINQIPSNINTKNLSENIKNYHPCIQSGLNTALAEINKIITYKKKYYFEEVNKTAILLSSKNTLEELKQLKNTQTNNRKLLTIKWKVGIQKNKIEEKILENILSHMTSNIKIRIDANGSWDRDIANRWADILKGNNNIDWIEQPLAVDDIEGMKELEKKVPVALDESLIKYPNLINEWNGWQIRRPSQERNPINLLKELKDKKGLRSISTSFETGIGRRLLYHLSSLQLLGPTPKVPGLALKNSPKSYLFLNNPNKIWEQL